MGWKSIVLEVSWIRSENRQVKIADHVEVDIWGGRHRHNYWIGASDLREPRAAKIVSYIR